MEAKPGRNVHFPIKEGNVPLVAQANFGLGRITVVAFDLDQAPFVGWKGEGPFWERLLQESGPTYFKPTSSDNEDGELLSEMQRGLETFEGIPTISFWWVALFILLYIAVVGPLDYYLLKKVFKRLELTWITFPVVVITVSALAYFTAYSLKGNDQKINKLDVVDIDMQTSTIQGNTWFSIFSPRIQNYTVGIEPAENWGIKKDAPPTPLVSWMGTTRRGRQSLFRRSYDYEPAASGLQHVPIQVWSTKGFQATWQAPIDSARPPVKADLLVRGREKISGSIESHLPVPLQDASLIYRNQVIALGTLTPDNKKNIATAALPMDLQNWLNSNTSQRPAYQYSNGEFVDPEPASKFWRSLMFHEQLRRAGSQLSYHNESLRELDQSWRLRSSGETEEPPEEAILVGKVAVEHGAAKDVAAKPGAASHLWLGALPDKSAKRPDLDGTMRQETYVRVFLKVRVEK
jgi:hypothetical protein